MAGAYLTAVIRPWARNDVITILVSVNVTVTAVAICATTLGPTRRALLPAFGAALTFAGTLGVAAIQRIEGWQIQETVAFAYDAVVVAVAGVLVFDLLRGRWVDAVVTGLVVDLGGRSGTTGLRGALAKALGDRSLVVCYWLPDEQRYVDDTGATLAIDELPAGRSATPLDDADCAPLAVLIHESAVLDDPAHITTIAAAARLAVARARLHAEAGAHIDTLAASRRRLVKVADTTRGRLDRQLEHDVQ